MRGFIWSGCSTMARVPSGNDAGLIETQPRPARVRLRRIAVTDVAEEVRLPRRVLKKRLVDLGVVKSRHRPGIQAQRPGRENEIRALQRSIAKRRLLAEGRVGNKHRPGIERGKQGGQMIV